MDALASAAAAQARRSLRAPLVRARHLGLRDADVVVASYPRSGSTWLTIMLGELLVGEPLDEPGVNRTAPMIGRHRAAPALLPGGGRLLRTHDRRLARSPRAVYVVRDPRDVAVSYYHYQHSHRGAFAGSLSDFVRAFVAGAADNYGRWDGHVSSWLDRSGDAALVHYRDLLRDPEPRLLELLDFLGAPRPPERVAAVARSNAFAEMQRKEDRVRDPAARPEERFVRSGVAGGWRSVLGEQDARAIVDAFGETMRRHGCDESAERGR
ncbi:MAG: sulfotransferase domain-containing protein [Gaiellaceae bacterium]